jgi:hypothetical protein
MKGEWGQRHPKKAFPNSSHLSPLYSQADFSIFSCKEWYLESDPVLRRFLCEFYIL